jgi:hypothetical protein
VSPCNSDARWPTRTQENPLQGRQSAVPEGPVRQSCLILEDAEKKKAKQRQVSAGCAILSEPIQRILRGACTLADAEEPLQGRQSAAPDGPVRRSCLILEDAEKKEATQKQATAGCGARARCDSVRGT